MTTNDQPAPAAGSATPRTDYNYSEMLANCGIAAVQVDFARTIERELNESIQTSARIASEAAVLKIDLTAALAYNVALREEVEIAELSICHSKDLLEQLGTCWENTKAQLATAQAKIAELERHISQDGVPDTLSDDELAQLDVSAQEFIRWRRSLGVFTRQPFAKCAWDAARSIPDQSKDGAS